MNSKILFGAVILLLSTFLSKVTGQEYSGTIVKSTQKETIKKELTKEEYLKKIYNKDKRFAENRERDKTDKPKEIIKLIGVKAGMTIGEAGAGDGYFTFFLSDKVGKKGVIYANDNSKYALYALEYYAEQFGATKNIISILGTDDDPLFPVDNLDMITIYGSLHDFTEREDWLKNARHYLKPGGKLAIIDGFYPEHGALTKELVIDLANQSGFNIRLYKDFSSESRSHHLFLFQKN